MTKISNFLKLILELFGLFNRMVFDVRGLVKLLKVIFKFGNSLFLYFEGNEEFFILCDFRVNIC